ncbi:MAG: hypothetical protein CVV27_07240 [Candidatus Melainabacteria bacterium HGW-Melainabacteria-1]|nr:MAG: hypothetical protein CVV27_07240 [Candidatus Melainabacteria bacterium HGW-Melainabacteria-1]
MRWCAWAAILICLSACQLPNATDKYEMHGSSLRPWQVIAEVRDPRFEALANRRLGAKVLDRIQIANRHYVLLGLDPERIRRQVSPLTEPALDDDLAWTRAAAKDLWTHHGQMLGSLDFNVVSDLALDQSALSLNSEGQSGGQIAPLLTGSRQAASAFVTQAITAPPPLFNDLSFGIGSGLEGWWRTETQVEGAWRYSIGTGVTAAYIDQGFVNGHPELARRMDLNGQNNQSTEYATRDPGNIELPRGDHGTASLLVGFGERDNHLPSVGVAPNARITPYVAVTIWDAARALYTAAKFKPDVIGMNFAFPIYPDWEAYGEYRPYRLLQEVFAEIAATTAIPVVVPAHNYGEPVSGGPRDWVPVSWQSRYSNIIGVGGIQAQSGPKLKAWFNSDLLTAINARGTNFGEGLIYAPATGLDIAQAHPHLPIPASMNGTSAACPFMTGAVALILSRLPDMPAQQLRDILRQTARPVDASELTQRPGATVPMIQVEAALREGLRQSGFDPERFRARAFTGLMSLPPGGQRVLKLSAGSTYRVLPSHVELLTGLGSELDGKQVTLTGWHGISPLQKDEFETLSLGGSLD